MSDQMIWLTTNDNPFDFFEQFDDWYKFDESKGYCTCSLIARITKQISEDFSDNEQNEIISNAINEIVSCDSLGIYKVIKSS